MEINNTQHCFLMTLVQCINVMTPVFMNIPRESFPEEIGKSLDKEGFASSIISYREFDNEYEKICDQMDDHPKKIIIIILDNSSNISFIKSVIDSRKHKGRMIWMMKDINESDNHIRSIIDRSYFIKSCDIVSEC